MPGEKNRMGREQKLSKKEGFVLNRASVHRREN
jgi:hypothetical protein